MNSSITLMLFVSVFLMVIVQNSDGRRIHTDNNDDFQISDAEARSFLDLADGYVKRAQGNCITCSIVTQSKCCYPDICIKKTFHNECMKIKPGK